MFQAELKKNNVLKYARRDFETIQEAQDWVTNMEAQGHFLDFANLVVVCSDCGDTPDIAALKRDFRQRGNF